MFFLASFYIALVIFGVGLIYKVSCWFRYSLDPEIRKLGPLKRISAAAKGIVLTVFSLKMLTLLKVLVLDVILQLKTLKESFFRWLMHILIYGGFLLLFFFHALDNEVTVFLFANYAPTLNPFIFLRNLFGLMVFAGIGLAVYRRFFMKLPRLKTAAMDHYALAIVAVIMLSGVFLEAVKITSHTRYKQMVQEYAYVEEEDMARALEAVWVNDYGLVSPRVKGPFEEDVLETGRMLNDESCISCHSRPQWAFLSYGLSRTIKPAAVSLDKAAFPNLLWYIHFLACFIGLAYLPFSKMFHILVTPLSLLANSVMERGKSDPLNIATRQAMELDACMHCGSCSLRCSVGVTYEVIPNVNILPSEKIASLKALAAGKKLNERELKQVQEGLLICTNCLRCTGVCPAGINLQELWLDAREAMLQRGLPEYLLLSPLSLYRGLISDILDGSRYPRPAELVDDEISRRFHAVDEQHPTFEPDAMDGEFKNSLEISTRGSTFRHCFTCQTCTSACPVVHNYDRPWESLGLVPHQIMHATALGLSDLIYHAKMLWACVGCYQCQQQCPQGVRVADVLYELKNKAFKETKEKALLK